MATSSPSTQPESYSFAPDSTATLSDLFRAWGQPLSPRRLATFPAPEHTTVAIFVDGRRRYQPPGEISLTPHAEIVLEVPARTYRPTRPTPSRPAHNTLTAKHRHADCPGRRSGHCLFVSRPSHTLIRASSTNLSCTASTEGVPMFTRRLSFSRYAARFLAAGIAAVVIGGGAVGIVSATSSSGSGTAAAATSPSATTGQRVSGGAGSNARSGPAAGGSSGTVDSVSGLGVHPNHVSRSEGDRERGVLYDLPEGDELELGERGHDRRTRPRTGEDQWNHHHGQPGQRATGRQQIHKFLVGRGGALPARSTVDLKAGRSDPSQLQPGIRDDRQRNGRQQGDRGGIRRLPGRRRV